MTQLALGTANWGAPYGPPGQPVVVDEPAAAELAAAFLAAGHDLVDTAAAYGDAELVVGAAFGGRARVVTKLSVHSGSPVGATAAVERSLRRTGVDRLAGVLLHDPTSHLAEPTVARSFVDEVRATGVVDRVGVSVYAPEEASAAVEVLGADLIQLPCNLLDQRFVRSGCLHHLRAHGVEVHVRSVFLNSVLLQDPGELAESLAPLAAPIARLREVAVEVAATPLELALAFTRDHIAADAVVVGAQRSSQLQQVLDAWASTRHIEVEWSGLGVEDARAVDPRYWV